MRRRWPQPGCGGSTSAWTRSVPSGSRQITRHGRLDDVWAGIAAAQAAGLAPIKLNMVVVRGLNDDEVVDFARRTMSDGWHVRFIELMPIGANVEWAGDGTVPIKRCGAGSRQRWDHWRRWGQAGRPATARRATTICPAPAGTVGFIAAMSEHFCRACNRLAADGRRPVAAMPDER